MYGYSEARNELSSRAYNGLIGLTLLWGFVVNILLCTFGMKYFVEWNYTAIIIGYVISCIIGCIMTSGCSDSPILSFIGYNLIVLPVGVVLSIGLADYTEISILNAIIVTAAVTVVMLIIGTCFPDVFLSMGTVLTIALSVAIICELVCLIIGIFMPTWWDAIIAVVFCLILGYDWAVAQEKTRTLSNAICSATSLYLSIINIFVRVLSVTGKKRD